MDPFISQNLTFLKSLPSVFPQSRFNYNRNKMGRSSCSLQGRMTHISTRRDPHIYPPFDADDLSRCVWWIIDNPAYWGKENFLSLATASPEWKGIIIWLIPLIQELMMTPTREEPDLSKWIRQIMNDSIDPPPHQNMEEAIELVVALKSQYNDLSLAQELNPDLYCSSLKISRQKLDPGEAADDILGGNNLVRQQQFWKNFQSTPQKLTNDLITICSQNKGKFRIVASKNPAKGLKIHILLDQMNRWTTKITYTPIIVSVMYYGEAE